MIEVQNLCKSYGDLRGIVDVSFSVEKGEIIGFLGPNGAGKTTTMRILTCFMPATSGKASVAGFDVFDESLEVRKRIGYLPETVPLYTDMQVPAYLSFVAGLKGVPFKDIKKMVAESMEQVGLAHKANNFIGELSKGYRQRVGLAQALINNPEVLILDEPTIGLDPKQIIEIRQLIKNLGEDRTIILSTHILPEVSMVCNRVVIIDEGRIKAVDTPENLMSQIHTSDRIEARLRGPVESVLEGLREIDGVTRAQHMGDSASDTKKYIIEFTNGFNGAPLIARLAAKKDWDLYELTPMRMSLEDIFIRIVTEEQPEEREEK